VKPSTTSWSWPRALLRALIVLVIAAVVAMGATLAWLRLNEDQLVFEAAASRTQTTGVLPSYAQRLTIPAADRTPLAAVLFRAAPSQDSGFWVLHLHGNATTAFSRVQLRHCEQLRALGLNVLAFDYRGFGESPGIASEQHLYEDADSAYQALVQRGIAPAHIIIWGHSLGTAAAVELATRRPAAALVLFGAFTSIPDAAAARYPYLPVRWVAGIHMDSLRRIRRVHIPVIVAHSVRDTLVPFDEGRRLYAAANAPKRFLPLTAPSTDGLGGHLNALYDHLDLLVPELGALAGVRLAPVSTGDSPPRTAAEH
jgi:uncharacterized protein